MTLKSVSDINGIFGIDDAVSFYNSISRTLDLYKSTLGKDVEKLIYVILGLNHLREWIAPGYDHEIPASSDAERFYNSIFLLADFKILKRLCESSKHSKGGPSITSVGFADLSLAHWRTLAEVKTLKDGYPAIHTVDMRDAADICFEVLRFYREQWFNSAQLHVVPLPDPTSWPVPVIVKNVPDTSGLFGVNTPTEFLTTAVIAMNIYKKSPAKDPELILYVLMVLNHLCEWIAPKALRYTNPADVKVKLYNEIHLNAEFLVTKELCNRSKHLTPAPKTEVEYSGDVLFDDDHRLFDSGGVFDDGPPTAYLVNGQDIVPICEALINYYKAWLQSNP